MKRVFDHIRDHLYEVVGYFDRPIGVIPPPDKLYHSEWCWNFERLLRRRVGELWDARFVGLMRNRFVMGAFRYGLFKEKHAKNYLYFRYAELKAFRYGVTGNLECLVDTANMALLEYLHPTHVTPHWADLNTSLTEYSCVELVLPLYAVSGNLAYLIDVAAMAMLEFSRPTHVNSHWSADASPGSKCPTV